MSTTAALVVPTLLAIPISLAAAGAVMWLEYMTSILCEKGKKR